MDHLISSKHAVMLTDDKTRQSSCLFQLNNVYLRLLQTRISPTNCGFSLNYLLTKEKEKRMRGGHMTGSFAGGSREGLQRGRQKDKNNLRSWSTDLAKLNP